MSDPTHKNPPPSREPILRAVGLGGAGNGALDRLVLDGQAGIEAVAIDADVQVLTASVAPRKVQLGRATTRGLGAGGDPEVGYEAAAEAVAEIKAAVEGADLLFLCAGLGGGIGSGGAPAVASIARQCGARVIAFATMPFGFEGRRRRNQAEQALAGLKEQADLVIGFENDRLGDQVAPTAGAGEAFAAADQTVARAMRAIADMLRRPGLVRLGLADLANAAAGGGGDCLFGFGEAEGDNRIHDALARALKSPLLDKGRLLDGAGAVLAHVMGGPGMTLADVEIMMRELGRHIPGSAAVSFGVAVDPRMGAKMSLALLASPAGTSPARPRAAALPEPIAAPPPSPERSPERQVVSAEPEVPEEPEKTAAPDPVFLPEETADAMEPPEETGTAGPIPERTEVLPPPAPAVAGPERAAPAIFRKEPPPAKEGAAPSPAKKKTEERQEQLMFEPISRGRFDKSEPTIIDGQDLDVPTFLRMNVKVK